MERVLKKYEYNVDYGTLVEVMNESLADFNFTQRPELNGSTEFFGKKFLQPFS